MWRRRRSVPWPSSRTSPRARGPGSRAARELTSKRPPLRQACATADVAKRSEVPDELIGPLLAAAGLADERFATEGDLETVRLAKTALDFGLPPEVLGQMLRVIADSTYKIADAGSRLFHLYVHEQMRAGGTGGAELLAATNAIGEPLRELAKPAVMYFYEKAWQQAYREDMMPHLAEEATA